MSAALGITPSDDDKFLPVEALDLEPSAPVWLVSAIGAFRDDALDPLFAGDPVEGWAMIDLVVVVPEAVWRTMQERRQPGLAVHQRQSSQVLAV
jgi:hypothetical protein